MKTVSISGLTNFKQWQIKILQRRFNQPNTLARKLVPPLPYSEFKEFVETQNPVSFLIVRHPYDRLLSAYRDKFESKKKYYHIKYGRFMIQQYRQRGIRRFGKAFYRPSKHKDSEHYPHWKAAQRKRNDATPTFWEFVKTIIDYKVLNEHWTPATLVCSVCKVGYYQGFECFWKGFLSFNLFRSLDSKMIILFQIRYDFILKMENLHKEESFMLRQLNLTYEQSEYGNSNPSKLSDDEKKGYFDMLNKNEKKSLHDIYRQDFEHFEYDPHIFD